MAEVRVATFCTGRTVEYMKFYPWSLGMTNHPLTGVFRVTLQGFNYHSTSRSACGS